MIIVKKQFGALVLGGANATQKAKVWSGVLNIIVTQRSPTKEVSDIDALEEFLTKFLDGNKLFLSILDGCVIMDSDRFHSNEYSDKELDNRIIVVPKFDIDGDNFENELEIVVPKLVYIPIDERHDVNISLSIKSV